MTRSVMNDTQEYPGEDKLIIADDTIEDDSDMYRRVADIETNKDGEVSYGKKVEKRINKVIAERNIERDKRQDLEREVAALKAKTGKDYNDEDITSISEKIEAIKEQKRIYADVLGDDYNYAKAEELNDELIELRLQQREARNSKESQKQKEEYKPEPPEQPEALRNWQERNGWVYQPERNAEKLEKTNSVYFQIIEEGYDLDDDDTYHELDRRLQAEPEKKPKREIPPSPSAVDRGTKTETTGFTNSDKVTMRKWGLDPDDATARAEYIKNKG